MASLQSHGALPAAGFEPECGTETQRDGGGVLDKDSPPDNVYFRSAPWSSFLLNLSFSALTFLSLFRSLRSYLCVILGFPSPSAISPTFIGSILFLATLWNDLF